MVNFFSSVSLPARVQIGQQLVRLIPLIDLDQLFYLYYILEAPEKVFTSSAYFHKLSPLMYPA